MQSPEFLLLLKIHMLMGLEDAAMGKRILCEASELEFKSLGPM